MRVSIRTIKPTDSPTVARIIHTVMPEFGASGQGFAIHDAEVQNMYEAYTQPRSAYFVCEVNGRVVGGAGIAPLQGGDPDTCELKKMYFLPEERGRGYGKLILQKSIKEAKDLGFKNCYVETYHTMKTAIDMYERAGFKKLSGSLGATGHFGCDTFFLLEL